MAAFPALAPHPSSVFVLFVNPLDTSTAPLPPDLQLIGGDGGGAAVNIGATVVPVTSVFLQDPSTRLPLTDRLVTLSFALADAQTDDLATRYGFQGSIYDFTGVPVGGAFALPGFVPLALRTPIMTAATARSDSKGYARFRKLSMALGLSGTYSVSVKSGIASAKDAATVSFTTSVAAVELALPSGLSLDGAPLKIGATLPDLTVTITDGLGAGVSGKRAMLLSAPQSTCNLFASF